MNRKYTSNSYVRIKKLLMFNKSIISRKKVLYKKYYVKIKRLIVFKKIIMLIRIRKKRYTSY